ncbi:hypothetical protein [Methylobacter luteus]|jgi:hypothetical protein|uniref:hypothetical protein n=1 Tax=Methylobacter luteus TaxID=415 RepID=UPI000489C047|nr:hypothetical protein [Methylobacter luteus]
MQVQMTLTIDYSANGCQFTDIAEQLNQSAQILVEEGLLSGNLDAEVNEWICSIDSVNTNGFVKNVKPHHSGGGVIIEMIELNDKSVIGITDDCIVLYPSEEALMDNEGENELGIIDRPIPAESSSSIAQA